MSIDNGDRKTLTWRQTRSLHPRATQQNWETSIPLWDFFEHTPSFSTSFDYSILFLFSLTNTSHHWLIVWPFSWVTSSMRTRTMSFLVQHCMPIIYWPYIVPDLTHLLNKWMGKAWHYGQKAENNKECGCRNIESWLKEEDVHHGGATSIRNVATIVCRLIGAVRMCRVFLRNGKESAERLEGQVREIIYISQHDS